MLEELNEILNNADFYETKMKKFQEIKEKYDISGLADLDIKNIMIGANFTLGIYKEIGEINKSWSSESIKARGPLFKKLKKKIKKSKNKNEQLKKYLNNLILISSYNLEILKYNENIFKYISEYKYLIEEIDIKYGKGKYLKEVLDDEIFLNEFNIEQGTEDRYILPNIYLHQDYIGTYANEKYLGNEGACIFGTIETNVESAEWKDNGKLRFLDNQIESQIQKCRLIDSLFSINADIIEDDKFIQSFHSIEEFRILLNKQETRLKNNMEKIMKTYALLLDIMINECHTENMFLELKKKLRED